MTPESLAKSGTEHGHQTALFAWAALNAKAYPMLKWMFAIKNVEKGGKIAGAMAKAEGVKAGVSDIFLPYAKNGYHGLFIEMKKPDGKASTIQLEFQSDMSTIDYACCIAYSWAEARDYILLYLK